jgi:hypothetical protein
MYASTERQELRITKSNVTHVIFPLTISQSTLHSAVFASPSRVKFADEVGLDHTLERYLHAAGEHANIATLVAAHALGMQYTATIMAGAMQSNKLDVVHYLHDQGCPWPEEVLEDAVESGFFQLVRWCYEHGCPWDMSVVSCNAALSGSVELMAWVLQQPGARLSPDEMSNAASEGHMTMCQYLRAQRCPWSERSTRKAASEGHLDVLRLLVDNGCPWESYKL